MSPETIQRCGDELFDALSNGTTLQPLTDLYPAISLDDAYHISLRILERRLQSGETVVGRKIGVTSLAVQQMLNVHQPDFGFLTDQMSVRNGSAVSISGRKLIQPKAEGEIAFRLKEDLQGPGVTEEQVLDATEAIALCFEIVDSRIDNWKIRIEDTVADNASCGVFVLGDKWIDPRPLDLSSLQMKFLKNDHLISEGKGAAVQGNPLTAVAWLANMLGEYGIPFKTGEVILSGSLVPLEPVNPGDTFRAEVGGMGSVSISFVE